MLEILTYPNDILRKRSREVVNPKDPQIKKLISDMIATLTAHNGIGLAAPQVGENLRMFIIEHEDEHLVFINPELKKLNGKRADAEEGCLSFPGKFVPIKRYVRVKVKALDANGNKQVIRAKGLLARAIQHEIDHLDGVLFTDRLKEDQKEEK